MVERYQDAIIPAAQLCRVMLQRKLMVLNQLERLERRRSQGHDHLRVHQRDRALKIIGTVANLSRARPATTGRPGRESFASTQK